MMRGWKRLVPVLGALLLLGGSAAGTREEAGFAPDATARSVAEEFLRENKLERQEILIGYYNTVTGEEYYLRGDDYLYPASMYKVALCMHYARQVADGIMDWDEKLDGLRLEQLVEQTLVRSDNACAGTLVTHLSNYMEEYRRIIAPFYGLDPMDAPAEYIVDGNNTPRQILFNLRLLYDYPQRFPRVTEYLLAADPNDHFLRYPQPWSVAHKYGVMDEWGMEVNDCAIVYTRSPFLLVVFTRNLPGAADYMSRLCTRLGEYTEFDTDRREAAAKPTASPTAVPSPRPTAAPTAEPPEAEPEPRSDRRGAALALSLSGGAALLLGYFLIVRRKDP